MDWLENLLPFILLFIYFLSRLGRQRNEQARPGTPDRPAAPSPPQAAPPRAPTPFEELIRQIQLAAEEAKQAQAPPASAPSSRGASPPSGQAAPTRRGARTQAFAPPPGEFAPPAPRALVPVPAPPSRPGTPEFHEPGGFEHDRHGFTLESPFSEEAFEELARGADVSEHAPGHLDYDPHRLARPLETPTRPHPLIARLRRPGAARDAFALREILDAPRSRRRRR
jgi:hypothetical protein